MQDDLNRPAGCSRFSWTLSTHLGGPQSRFGDKLLVIWLVCPQNGTAALKGFIPKLPLFWLLDRGSAEVKVPDMIKLLMSMSISHYDNSLPQAGSRKRHDRETTGTVGRKTISSRDPRRHTVISTNLQYSPWSRKGTQRSLQVGRKTSLNRDPHWHTVVPLSRNIITV